LHPARYRSNLTIRPRCPVDRVLLDGPRAVDIAFEDEATGRLEHVHGARITLAGGAIGTPAILLRAGIGRADELREMLIAHHAEGA
jgi:choline dehydrogenase-like flavoprotein